MPTKLWVNIKIWKNINNELRKLKEKIMEFKNDAFEQLEKRGLLFT